MRKRVLNPIGMAPAEILDPQQHFEIPIPLQECEQKILLIPKVMVLFGPFPGQVPRQKDVVKMYNNTGLQTWQDFEGQICHI